VREAWTKAEDERLIELELTYTPREQIVRDMGRTYKAICVRLSQLRKNGKLGKTRIGHGMILGFPKSPRPH